MPEIPARQQFARFLSACLASAVLACTAATSALAQNDDLITLDGGGLDDSSQTEFLRVEQAYVLNPTFEGEDLTLRWAVAPGYYLYKDRFKFQVQSDAGSQELTPPFPAGKRIYDEYYGKELTVYYNQVTLSLPLNDTPNTFQLKVTTQGCADAGLCYPPRTQYLQVDKAEGTVWETADSQVATPESTEKVAVETPPPAQPQAFLPLVLLAALVGGMILNLMPCVFPVLSLKALSFASSPLSAHKQHIHGWVYTAGVVVSFVAAAVVILVARTAGESIGWGFQLQSPVFIALMTYLFLAMALSLAGVFQVGTRLMGVGQSLTGGHGLEASFFTGVLAALVASPCTAPLMAGALGFAITQPAPIAVLVFASLGLGMALPFLLLSYSPKLAQRLPQPGPWMETLKQVLAFPLLLTCVWLLWVLGHQVNSDAVAALLTGGILLAFGCWLWPKGAGSKAGKLVARAVAVLSVVAALAIAVQVEDFREPDDSQWQTYSPQTLEQLRNDGIPVFINLTADWCITCLANERVALGTDRVEQTASELGIVLLKGDWTNTDPQITELLNRYDRNGVPLYLMYPGDAAAEAEVLPQVLTPSVVVKAMHRAAEDG